jgi:biopolymer transport protein ExbB
MPTFPYAITAILWLLAFFSVLTWSILMVKAVLFLRQRKANRKFLTRFSRIKFAHELSHLVRDSTGNLCLLADAFLEELESFANGTALDMQARGDMLRHTLNQERRSIQIKLETGLSALASIGSISTILGLLGTVWSIMNLLKAISSFSTTGLDVVAGPIGDALITTAVGIIVAVPALLGHNFFVRRVRVALMDMEKFCESLQHLAIRSAFKL